MVCHENSEKSEIPDIPFYIYGLHWEPALIYNRQFSVYFTQFLIGMGHFLVTSKVALQSALRSAFGYGASHFVQSSSRRASSVPSEELCIVDLFQICSDFTWIFVCSNYLTRVKLPTFYLLIPKSGFYRKCWRHPYNNPSLYNQ